MNKIIALIIVAIMASAGTAFADGDTANSGDASKDNRSLTSESMLAIDILDESIEGEGTIKYEGVTMVPLRVVLEGLGYEISWNGEKQSIDIVKDAQFTSIAIDSNSYYKNKMAPISLSSAPKLVDSKTYVPVEFLFEILGYGMNIDSDVLKIQQSKMAIQEGYITEVAALEDGVTALTIKSSMESTDPNDKLIIKVSPEFSIVNGNIQVGKHIKAICPNIMTFAVMTEVNGVVIYN